MSNFFRVLVSAFILTAFDDTQTLVFSEIIRRQMKSLLEESRGFSVEFWLAPVTLDDFFEDIGVDVEDIQVWLQELINEGFCIPSSYTYDPVRSGNSEQSVEQSELEYAIANHLDGILSVNPHSYQGSPVPVLALERCPTLDTLLCRICQAQLERLYQQEWRIEQLNRLINSLMIQLWLASTPQLSSKSSAGSSLNKVGKYLSLAIALISLVGQQVKDLDDRSGDSGSVSELRRSSIAEKPGGNLPGNLDRGIDQHLDEPKPLWEIDNGSKTSGGKSGDDTPGYFSSWMNQRLDDLFFLQKSGDTGLGTSSITTNFKMPAQKGRSEAESTHGAPFLLENFGRDSLNQIVKSNLTQHNNLQFVLTGDAILDGSSKQALVAGLPFSQFIDHPNISSNVLSAPEPIAQINVLTNSSYLSTPKSNSIDTITNLVIPASTEGSSEQYPVAVPYEPAIAAFNPAAFNSSAQVITDTSENRIITIPSNSGKFEIENFRGVGRGSSPDLNIINEFDTLQFSGAGLIAQNLLLNQNEKDLMITFEGQSIEVILKNFNLENLDNLPPAPDISIQFGNILFDGDSSIQDSFDVINFDTVIDQVLRQNTVTFLNEKNNQVIGFDNSNDVINGQAGDDILDGLGGDDTLRGGPGNDILIGGAGSNRLTGNEGVDTFVISMNGFSQVTDFKPGEDCIGLPNGVSEEAVQIESGTGTYLGSSLIRINNVLVMEIVGVNANTLLSTSNLFQNRPLNQGGWFP